MMNDWNTLQQLLESADRLTSPHLHRHNKESNS